MSGQGDEVAKSGMTTKSTDSGMGSASLSDPFVAIPVNETTTRSRRRIKAPEGSSAMEVRRSNRVAAARSRSILQPVVEENLVIPETSQAHELLGSMENMVGLRDTVNPQLRLSTSGTSLVGRKRSASGDAPGSVRQGHNPNKPLASADGFPPGHFEPNSNDHIPLMFPECSPVQLSPMRVDSVLPTDVNHPDTSPISSSISQNPLLRPVGSHESTPSPRNCLSASIHATGIM